ncbi:hypothetical protein LGH82_31600 [Mesorhizobium sp. PAMC28654]|uniref:hypothetical protein n=1 Tax=Mesorhizobium sp. PAMC28654 TaxID=2880934 RepID=UPI001D0A1351|nr:hypothetical protein [Mesorhizobium sp. PAMC28654]UDL89547.1 hypothetical protein LGH82_31600 [Mesorhizobium sp. PAMC28654]
MSNQPEANPSGLIDTLRRTWHSLRAIRRDVSDGGHIETMSDIDSLVGMAQQEAEHQLQAQGFLPGASVETSESASDESPPPPPEAAGPSSDR